MAEKSDAIANFNMDGHNVVITGSAHGRYKGCARWDGYVNHFTSTDIR